MKHMNSHEHFTKAFYCYCGRVRVFNEIDYTLTRRLDNADDIGFILSVCDDDTDIEIYSHRPVFAEDMMD